MARWPSIVQRAREIRRLKFEGLSDREVAERLGVSRKYISWLRRRAASFGIEIPRLPHSSNPTAEIVLGILQALAEQDSGLVLMSDVYRLYNIGAELGLWEPRTQRRILEAVRELEERGFVRVERAVSFGRYGRCNVVSVLWHGETAYKLVVEELLLPHYTRSARSVYATPFIKSRRPLAVMKTSDPALDVDLKVSRDGDKIYLEVGGKRIVMPKSVAKRLVLKLWDAAFEGEVIL